MNQRSHLVILASAGSGKTYQLTNRFLSLAMEGEQPSSMLATTFTRAAAAEIRDRVLSRLARAVDDEAERRALAEALHAPSLSRDRILDLLELMARRLHTLQIRTLDSFFNAVIRCFEMDLDLPIDARVADGAEAADLRGEAIRAMLDERDPQPLVNLLRELTAGRSERGVTELIDRTVSGLHDLFREAPAAAWVTVDEWAMLDDDELRTAIDRLHQVATATTWPDARMGTSCEKHIRLARRAHRTLADDWIPFISQGLASKIVASDLTHYGKPIPTAMVDALRPLIDHALAVLRNSVVSRTRATRDLLTKYDHAYRAARKRLKAMTFADLTHALVEGAAHLPLDDVYFRIDARLNHLLLDEMQDTSVNQWQAIKPLADEVLATRPGERTFFCVGDVKQSIYGWRDAAPELLADLDTRYPILDRETLDTSWRSSPTIVAFVNRVFEDLSSNRAVGDHLPAAEEWSTHFTRHEVAKKNTSLTGFAQVRVVREATDEERDAKRASQPRIEAAADLIQSLHARAPHRSIGVLVRTNTAAANLLYELGPASGRNVPATNRGSGVLTDAPPVNVILDLLRLADHPDHSIAAFNVMHSPLGAAMGFTDSRDQSVNAANRRRLARDVRRRVQHDGFAPTINRWIRSILSFVDQRQAQRLYDLLDLALQHDSDRRIRCDDFVAIAEAADIASIGSAPVEVMTIHKSKGLEFDIVVLPDLQGEFVSTRNQDVVVERDGPGGQIARIVRWVREDIWERFDDLSPLFQAHVQRMGEESLCLLYVALTRAKRGLYLLIDPPGTNKDGRVSKKALKSHAGIVWNALAPGTTPQSDCVIYEDGNESWIDEPVIPARMPRVRVEANMETRGMELAPSRRSSIAFTSSPSEAAEDDEGTRTLRDLLVIPNREARDRGTVIHAFFEQIDWLDGQAPPSDEQLLHIARRLCPHREMSWIETQINTFSQALANHDIRSIFLRQSSSQRNWRELPFVRETSEGMQRGSIDRLEATYDEDARTYTRVRVIDFKTDAISSEQEARAKTEHYRPQLISYRAAAAEFLRIDESRIELALAFVHGGWVMPLDVTA